MIQHEATIYLYSISSTALIKLSATNRTHLSTKLPEVGIVDTNLQKGLYIDLNRRNIVLKGRPLLEWHCGI